jgi:trimethylamine--corrinoid protein Co-methyltransferase
MEWLTAADREVVYAEALSILETVGMRMQGARVLPLLRESGASVDEATGVVRFPAQRVADAVASCPRDVRMAGQEPEQDVLLDGSRSFFSVSGCAAKTLDQASGHVRPSTLADLRDGTAVLDATEELDVVWTFVTATDRIRAALAARAERGPYLSDRQREELAEVCEIKPGRSESKGVHQ